MCIFIYIFIIYLNLNIIFDNKELVLLDYVVDCVFIPKRFSAESNPTCFSDSHGKQGIKLMVVVGRDGKIFNVHINENGGQSNCRTYLDSALGFTLRYHKRSVLNRMYSFSFHNSTCLSALFNNI